MSMRIGFGFDSHAFKGGVPLDKLIQEMHERVLAEGDLMVSFTPPRPGDLPNGKPPPKT